MYEFLRRTLLDLKTPKKSIRSTEASYFLLLQVASRQYKQTPINVSCVVTPLSVGRVAAFYTLVKDIYANGHGILRKMGSPTRNDMMVKVLHQTRASNCH